MTLLIEQPASVAAIERIDINIDERKNRTYSLVLLVESGMVFCGPTKSARDARRRERRAA